MRLRPVVLTTVLILQGGVFTLLAVSRTYTEPLTRAENPVVVTGEVVRLDPGKTLVIRGKDGETTYTLPAGLVVPADVQVGRTATVQFVPGRSGTSMVKRITTTTLTPEGQLKETTDITRTEPGGRTSRSTMTTLKGKVEAYVPGKSITVTDTNGARVTYVLGPTSQVPAEVLMGKEVTIQVAPDDPATVTYEVERNGDVIRIKARPKQD